MEDIGNVLKQTSNPNKTNISLPITECDKDCKTLKHNSSEPNPNSTQEKTWFLYSLITCSMHSPSRRPSCVPPQAGLSLMASTSSQNNQQKITICDNVRLRPIIIIKSSD